MTHLSVAGLGLVSAAGARTRDHAFYPRAEAPPPAGSPFRFEDGRAFDVMRAPFIEGFDGCARRLEALAGLAIDEALAALPEPRPALALYLCAPLAGPGLPEQAREEALHAIVRRVRPAEVHRLSGSAAPLAALADMGSRLGAGSERACEAALIVAVDSFVSLGAAAAHYERPPSPWLMRPLPPGEGAAAVVVTTPDRVAAWQIPALATIRGASAAQSQATDENDEVIDGRAMQAVLANLASEPIGAVFGQDGVDHLRVVSWNAALARMATRLHPDCTSASIEADIGRVGSAAGLMNLGYAIARLRHRTSPRPSGPLLAWAMSKDGLTAAATLLAVGSDSFVALGGSAQARRVARATFVPNGVSPSSAPPDIDEDVEEDEEVFDADFDEAAIEIERLALEEQAEIGVRAPVDIAPMPPLMPRGTAPLATVRVEAERGRLLTLPAFYADVVATCTEHAAMMVHDRVHGAWEDVADTERRLLCQLDAIVATGGTAVESLVGFWQTQPEDPWVACASALGLLGFEGEDATLALRHVLAEIGDDEEGSDLVAAVAEALMLSTHPGSAALVAGLAHADHGCSRAVGLLLQEPQPERIALALTDDATVVRCAAVWACDRLPEETQQGFAPWLHACLPRPEVWAAARQLALWGDPAGMSYLDALQPHLAVEMMVLAALPDDVPVIDEHLHRGPATEALIDAVARFGSPRTLDWLLSLVSHPELAEAAAGGLTTMLGAAVESPRRLDTSAWRSAIGAMGIDRARRYRRGKPWTPGVVLEECADSLLGSYLSRAALELRVDELRARLGLRQPAHLWRWQPHGQEELAHFLTAARQSPRGRTRT